MPPTYIFLPMNRWSSLQQGEIFAVGGRSRWDITLNVPYVSPGGGMTLIIEETGSPSDEFWTTLTSFTITGPGSPTKTTTPAAAEPPTTPDFTVNPVTMRYFRARITAIAGTVLAEVTAVAPFFDIYNTDHWDLVVKELRDWKDGRERIIQRAEDDVLDLVLSDIASGTLDYDLTAPGAADRIRGQIAIQAEYLLRKSQLERSLDPSSIVTLREMGELAPGIVQVIGKDRPTATGVWYGR
jgi:hypothetical protein